jgi:hypothetical protein
LVLRGTIDIVPVGARRYADAVAHAVRGTVGEFAV